MEKEYFAVFRNDSTIRKNTLEEALKVPYLEYVLERQIANDRTTEYGNRYTGYKYKIFNLNGEEINIRIGDFEIINIGDDGVGFNYRSRSISVYDHKNKTVHEFSVDGFLENCLFKNVISFVENLNSIGSYEGYLDKNKIDRLNKDLESKNTRIIDLESTISELKKEIEKLKEELDKNNPCD